MRDRVWIGLLLIVFGIGYLLQQADVLDFGQVLSTWWPIVLIIIGIMQLVNRTYSSPLIGLLFVIVGALFLVNEWVDVNVMAFMWPLILIIVGLAFLSPLHKEDKSNHDYTKKSNHTDQFVKTLSLFSGADIKSRSSDFKGGTVTTVFGGAEIDLREASISNGAKMDLTALFGGIEVKVPENTHVEISGMPVFGGWDNATRIRDNDADVYVLKLNCFPVFGGVDVTN